MVERWWRDDGEMMERWRRDRKELMERSYRDCIEMLERWRRWWVVEPLQVVEMVDMCGGGCCVCKLLGAIVSVSSFENN